MGMLMRLIAHGEKELKPYAEKTRSKCPFYGFNGMFGAFMDTGGNQCALIKKSYSPCQMEMEGKAPDWSECPFNDGDIGKDLESVMSKLRVFPKEFHPPEQREWHGVSLESWVKYITEGTPMTGK